MPTCATTLLGAVSAVPSQAPSSGLKRSRSMTFSDDDRVVSGWVL